VVASERPRHAASSVSSFFTTALTSEAEISAPQSCSTTCVTFRVETPWM
jgi:hypothetical protein